MRKSGFDKIISDFLERGVIYIGSSAGSIVAGPDIEIVKDLDEPEKADLESFEGLGLVDFVVFPHWGSENFKERYKKLIENNYRKGLKIILLTDDQYVMVEDDKYRIVGV